MRRLLNVTRLIIVTVLMLGPSTVPVLADALNPDDINSIYRDSVWYKPGAGANDIGLCSVSSTLIGSDNVQKAFYYFVGQGLSDVQSAAIVGNLMQESGVDPTSVQPNGVGHGIAQWSEPGRWDNLLTFASSRNQSPTDLGLQLDFMWEELNSSYSGALSVLRSQTDITNATIVFEQQYEAAGKPQMANRIEYAKEVLSKYGGTTVSSSGSSNCTGSGGTSASAAKIVQIALAEVGTSDNGSNGGAACKYEGSGCPQAWCADFISWVYKQANASFTGGEDGGWRIAGAAALADWFKANATWIDNPGSPVTVNDPRAPQPGDVVYYPTSDGHVNIVVSYDGKSVSTVGGNQTNSVSTTPYDVFGTAAGWGRLK
ncbi:CHAP domain-containing protein [Candidatus Saccharibacteria bacterium]|nr:CHAP domain-containing protein [Candidatus Saccharibacteria bacterium]